MKRIENISTILIKQKKAWGEILTGIEQRNKYHIYDEHGQELYFAGENHVSIFWRFFMKALRPFEIQIIDEMGAVQLIIRRPFRWMFQECSIFSPDETLLANVKWEFAVLNRKYVITDHSGAEIFRLFGPLFKPWTFKIMKFDHQIGIIAKRWSGLFKEAFSDEDHFGLMLDEPASLKDKEILLGSVFLIDFVHFERK